MWMIYEKNMLCFYNRQLLHVNGATVEVQEWISKYISHFIMDVITYPRWDYS